MLWRSNYSTRDLSPVAVPPFEAVALDGSPLREIDCGVLCGGFDLRAQSELGVWSRLLAEAGVAVSIWTVFFFEAMTSKEDAAVRAMTPRSQWASVAVAPVTSAWLDLIQPDRPERSFAGLLSQGTIDPLMVGLPTEEAWDRFKLAMSVTR